MGKVMIKLMIVSFCVCITFSGCRNRNEHKFSVSTNNHFDSDRIYYLNFEDNLKNAPIDTFTINSIAKNITFIPLETSAEALLTVVDLRVASVDGSFYVSSMAGSRFSGIIEFDSTGHFKDYLVRIGRGPKELPSWFQWSYNNNERLLSAYASSEVLLHSFARNSTNKYDIGYFANCRPLNDGTIVGLPNITGTGDTVTPYLRFLNQEGDVMKSLYYPKKRNIDYDIMATQGRDVGPMEAYCLYPSYSGDALFQDMYNDTIYRVSSIDDIKPYIILGRGSLAPNVKEALDKAAKAKRVTIRRLLEAENYIFIVYQYRDMHYSAIWDKRNSTLIANMETDFFKIPVINNLGFTKYRTPTGIEIFVGLSGCFDDKLYGVLRADQAMDFISGIREDDNPVLMVIELINFN